MTQIVSQTVEPSRIPVLLPGMHMILEICDVFNTEEIMISDTGIREGFLMACIADL
jgi:exopolyphosphatase/guanosine-5'-triphosphate,3'-diphosphate pyrophosphatase